MECRVIATNPKLSYSKCECFDLHAESASFEPTRVQCACEVTRADTCIKSNLSKRQIVARLH